MRSLRLSDLAGLVLVQALAVVLGCTSIWGVWLWLAQGRPFG